MKLLASAIAMLVLLAGQASAQMPKCPDHVKVLRSNGTWKVFAGHDPADPWVCVGVDTGALAKMILNVWPIGVDFPDPHAIRVTGGLAELKAQIGAVITGPVGSQGHWSRVDVGAKFFDTPSFTLVHEADEVIMVGGWPHETYRLRLIGQGAGRSAFDVTTWFDKELLFALKRVDGHAKTSYDVVSIGLE
jgi:hypothetical protein